jgi:hypothetical protein
MFYTLVVAVALQGMAAAEEAAALYMKQIIF